jgi:transcriptional regulator with XRE-family HTH domain
MARLDDSASMFRARLREVLKDLGWTQTDLARRVGRTQAAVSQWLTGGTFPSLETIRQIARVTNRSWTWFIDPAATADDDLASRLIADGLATPNEAAVALLPIRGYAHAGGASEDDQGVTELFPVRDRDWRLATLGCGTRVEGDCMERRLLPGDYVGLAAPGALESLRPQRDIVLARTHEDESFLHYWGGTLTQGRTKFVRLDPENQSKHAPRILPANQVVIVARVAWIHSEP